MTLLYHPATLKNWLLIVPLAIAMIYFRSRNLRKPMRFRAGLTRKTTEIRVDSAKPGFESDFKNDKIS